MGVMQTVKDHPYLTAGGVFVLGVVLVIMFSGGGDKASSMDGYLVTDNTSTVAANTQLAMMQAQTSAALSGMQVQAGVENNKTAASIEIAKLTALLSEKADANATTVALSQIAAQKDTQDLISTLSAQVSQAQINASVQMQQIQATSQETMMKTVKEIQLGTLEAQHKQMTDFLAHQDRQDTLEKRFQYLEDKRNDALVQQLIRQNYLLGVQAGKK